MPQQTKDLRLQITIDLIRHTIRPVLAGTVPV